MDLNQIQFQLERFIVFIGAAEPGPDVLVLLGVVAAILWLATVMVRWVSWFAVALIRAVVTAVAGLSTVVAAGVVLAVFVLAG
jgi:hypothetical protein